MPLISKQEAINRRSLEKRNETKREKNKQKANAAPPIVKFEVSEDDSQNLKEVKETSNKMVDLLTHVTDTAKTLIIDVQKVIAYEEENKKRITNLVESKAKRPRSS